MRKQIRELVKQHDGDFGEAVRNLRRIEEELKLEQSKKLLLKNGGKIPYHRWYKKEQYNYEAYASMKGKVTGYFKTETGRYGGKRKPTTFYKVHESGFMVSVNITMFKIGVSQSLTTPHGFQVSNKREFDKAFKSVLNLIK